MAAMVRVSLVAAALCLASCVTSGPGGAGGGGGGGTGTTPAVVVSGGPVGADCPKEDQIGCAPGATAKVRCKAGKWVNDGDCTKPQSCVETKSGDVVSATQCKVPPTARTQRAIACVKADLCIPGVSMSECMDPPTLSMATTMAKLVGIVEPGDLLLQQLEAQQGCFAAAQSCDAVLSCLKTGNHSCGADTTAQCAGSKVQLCSKGVSAVVDCQSLGLPCGTVGVAPKAQALCAKFGTCSTPKTFVCNGNSATVCVGQAGQNFAFSIDCGAVGATCDPTMPFDDDPDICKFPGAAEACDSSTFSESCVGSKARECKGGKVQVLDCAGMGFQCATYASSGDPKGKLNATCLRFPACAGGISTSSDSKEAVFCDGAAGYRSLDCALAGMKFEGFQCVFPTAAKP